MCRCPDYNSVLARFPCCLEKDPLKRDLSEIYLLTFFGVGSFENTLAMRIIFFSQIFKI